MHLHYRANTAHFAPPDESQVRDDMIENVNIPRVYLHSTFVGQDDISVRDVWIADS